MVLLAKALPWVEWPRHSPTHMVWADERWFPGDKWWSFRRGQVFKDQIQKGILNCRLRGLVSRQTEWNISTDPDDSQTEGCYLCHYIIVGWASPKHNPQKSLVLVCPSDSLFWPGEGMEGVVATDSFVSFSVWNTGGRWVGIKQT